MSRQSWFRASETAVAPNCLRREKTPRAGRDKTVKKPPLRLAHAARGGHLELVSIVRCFKRTADEPSFAGKLDFELCTQIEQKYVSPLQFRLNFLLSRTRRHLGNGDFVAL